MTSDPMLLLLMNRIGLAVCWGERWHLCPCPSICTSSINTGHHGEVPARCCCRLCPACAAGVGKGTRISSLIVSTLQGLSARSSQILQCSLSRCSSWEGSPSLSFISPGEPSKRMLTEAMGLARMTTVQTPWTNTPGGPSKLFVECDHQLGLGSPGPALGQRKRTVGSVSPSDRCLDHLLQHPCLAPGPGSSGHCSTDWPSSFRKAGLRILLTMQGALFSMSYTFLLRKHLQHTCYPDKGPRGQGSKVSLAQEQQEIEQGMPEEQGKHERKGRKLGNASLLLLILTLTVHMRLDCPSGQVSPSN